MLIRFKFFSNLIDEFLEHSASIFLDPFVRQLRLDRDHDRVYHLAVLNHRRRIDQRTFSWRCFFLWGIFSIYALVPLAVLGYVCDIPPLIRGLMERAAVVTLPEGCTGYALCSYVHAILARNLIGVLHWVKYPIPLVIYLAGLVVL